ncbi:MAG: M23 family metallopeptidase [Firmicutes bacterium]|nr:M23 family metallopeptidase [Bacillota bacterium]
MKYYRSRQRQRPRSDLRQRLEQRQLYKESFGGFGKESAGLPVVLLRQLQENLFEKTVAAIMVVLILGAFSLWHTDFTGRVVDWVYTLTVSHSQPSAWLERAKPVMQTLSNLYPSRDNSRNNVPADTATGEETWEEETMVHPVSGVLSSPFGTRPAADGQNIEMHYGIDVTTEPGAPVYAAFAGKVSLVQEHERYGTTIYLQHDNDLVTIYGRVTAPLVAVGEQVAQGQEIAKVAPAPEGESHLHFEIWENKRPVDPQKFLTEIN